ncbi:MAG: glycosyltransferase [Comamonadaceae bacterium]|nr:glycosyltransferase [Comamonadaceae bacterium]
MHVITDLSQGGAEAMLEKLLLTSRAMTPEVVHRVVSLRSTGTVGPRLSAAGIRVDALGATGLASLPACLSRLTRLLAHTPPHTLVQTWLYHADLLGGLAAWRAGRRVVWNVRQTGLGRADIDRATRAVVRACGLLSRHIPARILCNANAAIPAHARFGYDASRFRVIPNGFDTAHFARDEIGAARTRAAWGLADGEIAVGLVARLDPQKDHATFIRAAAIAAARVPALRFVLVGRGIPDSAALRAAIAEAGLSRRFVLDAERSDIARVMSALDIFCLSSRAEGFPNALGEAMACETPAVSTDCGDARIVLGDDARIAPVQDAAALAERVITVATLTTAQRRALGARQRERIVHEFDIHQVWSTYLALYKDLVGAAGPAT